MWRDHWIYRVTAASPFTCHHRIYRVTAASPSSCHHWIYRVTAAVSILLSPLDLQGHCNLPILLLSPLDLQGHCSRLHPPPVTTGSTRSLQPSPSSCHHWIYRVTTAVSILLSLLDLQGHCSRLHPPVTCVCQNGGGGGIKYPLSFYGIYVD
ncbi:hypothetical protein NHX12_020096 [Muraenolepis orangiensis]|uniref:Uncharacterized protein n=1 Tax=Muraenolepis orangiensis TaxID=630683 RepID=A0A9Q0EUN1_9TELE|nr:hypothetical protein NHX12_020096 [Muraenolepis orangiensis]